MHFGKGREHVENNPSFKGLKVNKGTEHLPSLNPEAAQRFLKTKQPVLTVEQFVAGILAGNITILSRAVTLVESSLPKHQELAQQIIMKCLPYAGKSIRLGITGVPGAGKSTFIEALGTHLINEGHRLAVLAIDPSSERTKGSILGDKTRMEELSAMPNAYIRPSPSAGSLGGVARKTRETIILCEAAGFDTIFIETVGVGQSETAVHSMVDFFLLILIAGAGDELQGIKRGIVEMADGIAVNKADGQNVKKAELARTQYRNALHLFPPSKSGWIPRVETCSSLKSSGVTDVWAMIEEFVKQTRSNGFFNDHRKEQAKYWMVESIQEKLKNNFFLNPLIKSKMPELEGKVKNDELSSFEAARMLLDLYFDGLKK
ncbi:methylmalonyl Co-A mutase-associated GTPase MeaB [Geofilum rubicundum]|uniref:Putative periplasmic protein kinase ArgK and related GTPases of G3E family n=1 Tax=Geofilum rubicundum JCM 15548 TaxID=1236989 RepID=A0A0E9M313_9BACT|nr:methylmalonyl Co-A mutase-associated GTPase MeaB [Geofilum rubicundum]GAO31555.1 putative periplasmic protein kinase ArgK and related GTPases of G3E family [Geofilum rubicundum JCM 15548]